MGKKADKESDHRFRYLPYTQISMGMIQPEWIFMTHLFEREEEEEKNPVTTTISQAPPAQHRNIQINFRPRKF
ncbi:hypothetical protein [Thermoactinomyces mirandus]|uniref:Uncharacterized protein n=1 Tax=Thermoactinomyces mirandus TaxID=2756294 RepID=A0A7W1XR55_9BACL|nr:hypothetical protein [Thermoactinomyces mirandus]MBA4601681.1 hypothetical protein [Thermoactinomyces mirandus]